MSVRRFTLFACAVFACAVFVCAVGILAATVQVQAVTFTNGGTLDVNATLADNPTLSGFGGNSTGASGNSTWTVNTFDSGTAYPTTGSSPINSNVLTLTEANTSGLTQV